MKDWFINIIKKSFILQLVNMLLMFVTTVMLTRILGPQDFGKLTYVLSIVAILTIPVALGLPNYLIREVSKKLATEKKVGIRHLLKKSTSIVVYSSIIVLVLVVAFTYIVDIDISDTLIVASLSLFLLGFNQVRMGVLKGYHEIIKSQIPEKIVQPFFYMSLIFVAYFVVYEYTVNTVIVLYLASLVASFLFGLYYLKSYILNESDENNDEGWRYKDMLMALAPFSLLAGLQVINQNIDFVLIGALSNNESEVAFFKIAFQVSMLTFTVGSIVNSVISPRITEMYQKNQLDILQKFVAIGASIAFFTTLVISFVFILYSENIIEIVYGVEYLSAKSLLVVLLFQKVFITFFGPVHVLLAMTGWESRLWRINLVFVVVRIILDYILIKNYGAMGAVTGMFVTTAIHVVVLWLLIRKELCINSNAASIMGVYFK